MTVGLSVQYAAATSQKLTCPCGTAVPAVLTVAVNVTTLPQATELVSEPSEVIAKEVEEDDWAAKAWDTPNCSAYVRVMRGESASVH